MDPLSPVNNCEKKPFLEAIIIVSDAIILWAKRHAEKAKAMAGQEKDPVRKQELLAIAKHCEHVPANPARNFREAMQSQWTVQMFSRLEQKTGTTISNGRMDQYFYPFYKNDVETGILTDDQAIELFECMWVGMAQFIDMYISPAGGAFNEGYAHWEAVTVGGQTPEGHDATNELTYLILKSKREFPLHYPDLAARIHARAPERYLWEVAETIKEGSGFPKLKKSCPYMSPKARPLKKPMIMPFRAAPRRACPTGTPTPAAAPTSTSRRPWKWRSTTAA
jgi:formate C-acetyltransferase